MSFEYDDGMLTFVDLDGQLEMLSDDLIDVLPPAKGDRAKQRLALCRCYKSGIKVGISWEHLANHLGDGDFFIDN